MNPFKFLWPAAWQRPQPLDEADQVQLWSTVGEHDNCLRAVRELLGRHLEESAAQAGSISSDDTTKLRACERMECFRMLLLEIEQHQRNAQDWRRRNESQPPRI